MNIVVKICFCVVGYVLIRQLVPDTFQYGYIAGALIAALLALVDSFSEGWNKAKRKEVKP